MARFSLGGDDDSDEAGPSRRQHPNPNPNPKRMRLEIHLQEPRFDPQTQSEQSEEPGSESDREDMAASVDEQESEHESEDEEQQQSSDDAVLISWRRSLPRENGVEEGGGDGNECHVMMLSDPDVLDCPICLEPLTIPVFQCDNGHIACSLCSTKVRNKCPSCTLPIGYNRCRAIEKVIESVKISCRNSKYGCTEKTRYCDKNEHENTCTYAPCSCPQFSCTFTCSSFHLSAHFNNKHPSVAIRFLFNNIFQILMDPNEKFFVLQETGRQLFILNNIEYQNLGNLISVSCIKPSSSKEVFSYHVMAKKDGCVVKLESTADNMAKRVENPNQKRFLMVPRDFVNSSGKIKLEVNILNQLPKTPPRYVKMLFTV